MVKKDGIKEEFNKDKVLKGLLRAAVKRNIQLEVLETLVDEVEKELQNNFNGEVKSEALGELIMKRLKLIDEVAYVRFASVYKNFNDVKSFIKEIEELNRKGENT